MNPLPRASRQVRRWGQKKLPYRLARSPPRGQATLPKWSQNYYLLKSASAASGSRLALT